MSRVVRKRKPPEPPRTPLAALLEKHLEDLRVKNYSEYTVKNRRVHIGFFLDWAFERGITEPVEVTRTLLETYQRHVFILETLYSTGMRRLELVNLTLWDLDLERCTVAIRKGKGKKDRIIPLGDRAAAWVGKHLEESRARVSK